MRLVVLALLGITVSGCRLVGALPCTADTHCSFGEACVQELCVPAPEPGRDAGPRDDAGPAPIDGGPSADDAGLSDDDAGRSDDDAGVVDGGTGPAGWWDTAWRRRVRIDLDTAGLAAALDAFPLFLALPAAEVDLTGAVRGALRFVDADGTAVLAHEVEELKVPGRSAVWVKIPRVDPGGDFLWLYFDNPAAADDERPADVWGEGYVGVWHLAEDPGGAIARDASPSLEHGTPRNFAAADRIPGVVGPAFAFDGSTVVDVEGSGARAALDVVGGYTLSAWVLPANTSGGTILARREGGVSQWQLELEQFSAAAPQPALIWNEAGGAQCIFAAVPGLPAGEWHHVAVTVGTNGRPLGFFLDGVEVGFTDLSGCTGSPQSHAIDVAIGARWAGDPNIGFPISARIDEVRVEAVARPALWIAAQVATMIGTGIRYGAVEALP